MMSSRFLAATLAVLIIFCGNSNLANAGGRSVGLYGFERQKEAGTIPAEYDLVIVRYFAGQRNGAQVVNDIRDLASKGRRVVVEFQFMNSMDQRNAKAALPPIDKTASQLGKLLKQLDGVALEGVVLEEENRIEPERLDYLAELYKRSKATFPDRHILQWLSMGTKQIRTGWNMDQLPADGFVVDPHLLSGEAYRKLIEVLSAGAKPIYSVVWASPGWKVGGGVRKVAAPEWWNRTQWRMFYNRLAVNQHFGVNTLLFSFALVRDKAEPLGLGNKCDRNFSRELREKTIPYLDSFSIDMTIPKNRPNWIPSYC